MSTLAPGGQQRNELDQFLAAEQLKEVEVFDRAQLAFFIGVCRRIRSLSEAGTQDSDS